MSVAIIEAKVEAQIAAERVEQAHEEVGKLAPHNREHALYLLVKMGKASDTITRCAERMQTCKPAARFTYSAHITKAKGKFSWAHTDFQRLT